VQDYKYFAPLHNDKHKYLVQSVMKWMDIHSVSREACRLVVTHFEIYCGKKATLPSSSYHAFALALPKHTNDLLELKINFVNIK